MPADITQPTKSRKPPSANTAPDQFRWLRDPDLLRRLSNTDVVVGSDDAEPVEPVKRTRKRKPTIATMIKQARKAGETGVVRVSVTDPNGFTVTVASGDQQQHAKDDDASAVNPWDEAIKHATH
jgi:hypothetical protein